MDVTILSLLSSLTWISIVKTLLHRTFKSLTVPKKSKTIGEEGHNIQIGFPELENFPEQEVPITEDSATTNAIVVHLDAAEENADVLIAVDPRQVCMRFTYGHVLHIIPTI